MGLPKTSGMYAPQDFLEVQYNTLVRNIKFCLNFGNLSVLKVYAMYFSVYNIRACAVTTDLNVNRESFLLTPEFVMAH